LLRWRCCGSGGATAANSARLTDQALAQVVARNLSVEALTDPQPPTLGTQTGVITNAGRQCAGRASWRAPLSRGSS
jgi:general secretion pathway protein I